MNTLTISVCFKDEPTPEEKEHLQSQLLTFTRVLAPDAEISVQSGKGSWWIQFVAVAIVPGTWLLLEMGSWAIGKVLDKLASSAETKIINNTSERHETDSHMKQTSYTEISEVKKTTHLEHPSILNSSSPDEEQRHIINHMAEAFSHKDMVHFTVSEWSDKSNRGRIIDAKRTKEGKLSISVYSTDSNTNFDSKYDEIHKRVD
jgi:hypothetical protein